MAGIRGRRNSNNHMQTIDYNKDILNLMGLREAEV